MLLSRDAAKYCKGFEDDRRAQNGAGRREEGDEEDTERQPSTSSARTTPRRPHQSSGIFQHLDAGESPACILRRRLDQSRVPDGHRRACRTVDQARGRPLDLSLDFRIMLVQYSTMLRVTMLGLSLPL